jgi:hypothetical protein
MAEMDFRSEADRAYCPGCGASLELKAEQAIMTCRYCGSECKVVRRLRRLEPELADGPPPRPPIDPGKDYAKWGCEALVWGILNGTDMAEQIKMASELDAWPHTSCMGRPGLLPRYVQYMLTAEPELDKAMRGVIGKMICCDDLTLRNLAIRVGQKYGFSNPGSKGLLFSLSLGDAGTVKLLLEIAEWAQERGAAEYCHEALMAVQTAVGREANYRHLCNQILLHRLPYVHGQVRDWILNHTRLEFDVGYRQHWSLVLELIDDMATEQPDLIEPLKKALRYCGSAEDEAQYKMRVRTPRRLRSRAAKLAALEAIKGPPHTMAPARSRMVLDELKPNLDDPEFAPSTAEVLKNLLWLGDGVPASLNELWNERGESLPRVFVDGYKLRAKIR